MIISLRQKIEVKTVTKEVETSIAHVLQGLKESSSDFSYTNHNSFLAHINDKSSLDEINQVVRKLTKKGLPNTVFVVGIGGANLASKAIHDALAGFGETAFDAKRKMIFLDAVDSSVSEPVLLHINTLDKKDDFVTVIVSRSGETLETLANAEFLLSHLESKFGNISDRVAVVTGKKSGLSSSAKENGITVIGLPDTFSDRFGAFAPTTIVPLALYGYLVEDIFVGAREFLDNDADFEKSLSVKTALMINEKHAEGFDIFDLFFFSPRLETLGKWQRQLVAESLGKGGKGITPTVSIGTTDLHSALQLVLDGPRNKITSFVSVRSAGEEKIGDAREIDALPRSVTDRSFSEINEVILSSVQESYFKNQLPFFDLVLSDVSLRSLGGYMVYAMLQTVIIGKLWNLNVFDQPAVEEYKVRARQALE